MSMSDSPVSIILPSYKPDEKLLSTVLGLKEAGFDDIIVVDDGGGKDYNKYFDEVRAVEGCTVLVHPENRGKGAALKTAFRWYLDNRQGRGVITVDGDGQHRPEDIVICGEKLLSKDKVILGCRDFTQPDVPARSAFGNKFSCGVFKVLVGMKISDTQTGLRAIPTKYLDMMCTVKGDRYEYETNMLLFMKRHKIPYSETKIRTVYINENETSHFRPVRDSMRIYSLIFKYLFTTPFMLFLGSSMICYFFDWLMFTGINFYVSKIAEGLIITVASYGGARLISSMLNFYLNRLIFKKQGGSVLSTMIKYYLLVAFNLLVGSVAVHLISTGLLNVSGVVDFCRTINAESPSTVLESVIKLPVDGMLYVCSYTVQKYIVFKKDGTDDAK
ncbi:MAG: glycosyltransferase family 2 protein [Ruminococcaceae bacterium]|nr:glycosyltransferase family 2 protein [Oscillospiraceae bacterium]